MLKISIDREKATELRSIANAPIEMLRAGLEALKKHGDLTRRKDIKNVLTGVLDKEASAALSDMLLSFSLFVDSSDSDIDEVLASLVEGAESADLTEGEVAALKERVGVIKEMCEVPRVTLIGKSIDIRESAGPKLLRAKLYTTSRPIFDIKREEIEGSIVLSTLRLDHINEANEAETFEVVLTLSQLERLQKELTIGAQKARTYSDFLKRSGIGWVLNFDG